MFLDRIVATKQKEVEQLKQTATISALENAVADMKPCLGFENKLSAGRNRNMGLIAEVKKLRPLKA